MHIFNDLILKLYSRLLNNSKINDYFYFSIMGFIPIAFSFIIGIWNPIDIGYCNQTTSFKDASNFWTLVFILPVSLFLLRYAGKLLFGINTEKSDLDKIPLLTLFTEKDSKNKIHGDLQKTLLNKNIPIIIFIINIIIHYFDMGDVLKQYFLTFLGRKEEVLSLITVTDCNIKNSINIFSKIGHIYWANLFLLNKTIDIKINYIFTISAYLCQFVMIFIALTGITMFLLYNLFYLQLIYQRRRVKEKDKIRYHIVFKLNDQSKRFGLKEINKVFNFQIFVLIIAGFFTLFSRYTVLPQSSRLNFNSINEFLQSASNFKLSTLFPQFGQYVLLIKWLIGFIVVLLPSFAKFLPIFSFYTLKEFLSNLDVPRYLQEFIPPNVEKQQYQQYDGNFDIRKAIEDFKNNSFWPMGDDLARLFFYYVFFIFYAIVLPFNINILSFFILCGLAVVTGKLFLEKFYNWNLSHIDRELVNNLQRITQMTSHEYNINATHNTGVQNILGTMESDIENRINQLPDTNNPNQPAIKELLTVLKNKIISNSNISDEKKKKALKELEKLVEVGQNPDQSETKDTAENTLTMLKGILVDIQDTGELLQLLPEIAKIFDLTL